MPDLTPQLSRVADELEDARRNALRIAHAAGDAWGTPPEPGAWSVSECLQHLNQTSEAYLPHLSRLLHSDEARPRRGRHRRDLMGWVLCRTLEPPVRMKTKTAPGFVPPGVQPKQRVIAEFDRLQRELTALLPAADGLDLRPLKVQSPFSARVRYNLYSAFKVIAAHQRRHLWQAERALERVRARG